MGFVDSNRPKKRRLSPLSVDYRSLNAVTVKDAFPLPNIDNTLLALGGKKVFSTLQHSRAGLRLKVSKCRFAVEELPFLGHILTTEGIKMDAGKVEPFIYGFGTTAAPLYQLLKKDTKFFIGDIERKQSMAAKTNHCDFMILTDASKIGVAAVLCQPDEMGNTRPIYFASHQCNRQNYCPTELEALAVCFGTKKFAQFITIMPTRILRSSRIGPEFKNKTETGNSRVDKWLMELNAKFILQVEYHPGNAT
uniref:Reverse transcriptase RNase H-like domain-containing protein n=1 Tax=Globodera rostochiensis TaxID=31243 RepID=A0A914H8H4_GLORO